MTLENASAVLSQFERVGEARDFRERHFCPRCGSRLFSVDGSEAEIKLGIVSEAPTCVTTSSSVISDCAASKRSAPGHVAGGMATHGNGPNRHGADVRWTGCACLRPAWYKALKRAGIDNFRRHLAPWAERLDARPADGTNPAQAPVENPAPGAGHSQVIDLERDLVGPE